MKAIEITKETNEKLERIGRAHFMGHVSFGSATDGDKVIVIVRDSLMDRLRKIQEQKGFDSLQETVDAITDHFIKELPTVNRN